MSLATFSDSGQTCSRIGCYSPATVFDHCPEHAGPLERSHPQGQCRAEGCTKTRSARWGDISDGIASFFCSPACKVIWVRSKYLDAKS